MKLPTFEEANKLWHDQLDRDQENYANGLVAVVSPSLFELLVVTSEPEEILERLANPKGTVCEPE